MIELTTALHPDIRAHVQAILDRLADHPELANIVFEGTVPSVSGGTRNNYVSVFWNSGLRTGDRLDNQPINIDITFTFHWVSVDPTHVGILMQAGMDQLLGWRPQIDGRSTWRLDHLVSRPIDAEKSVNPWLWFAVDQFRLRSTPNN